MTPNLERNAVNSWPQMKENFGYVSSAKELLKERFRSLHWEIGKRQRQRVKGFTRHRLRVKEKQSGLKYGNFPTAHGSGAFSVRVAIDVSLSILELSSSLEAGSFRVLKARSRKLCGSYS